MHTIFEAAIDVLKISAGVVLGWLLATLARRYEESLFGAKLVIECIPQGSSDETSTNVYAKCCVRNKDKHRIAKDCRAYLIALRKFSNGKAMSDNLILDTFQLPWAGYDFEPRNVPALVNQYVDLVVFQSMMKVGTSGRNRISTPALECSPSTGQPTASQW